jgi:hypothetical protein
MGLNGLTPNLTPSVSILGGTTPSLTPLGNPNSRGDSKAFNYSFQNGNDDMKGDYASTGSGINPNLAQGLYMSPSQQSLNNRGSNTMGLAPAMNGTYQNGNVNMKYPYQQPPINSNSNTNQVLPQIIPNLSNGMGNGSNDMLRADTKNYQYSNSNRNAMEVNMATNAGYNVNGTMSNTGNSYAGGHAPLQKQSSYNNGERERMPSRHQQQASSYLQSVLICP